MYAGLNQMTGELMAVKSLQLVGRKGSAESQAQLRELKQVRLCECLGGCVRECQVDVCLKRV